MDINQRIAAAEQTFNTKNEEREKYIKAADECLIEMNKLQGEYRVLVEIRDEAKPQANVIDAVPETKSKGKK